MAAIVSLIKLKDTNNIKINVYIYIKYNNNQNKLIETNTHFQKYKAIKKINILIIRFFNN